MRQLRKTGRWPTWKSWLFTVLVFLLGILIGRLLINEWQLMAGIGAVLLCLVLFLMSEYHRSAITRPGKHRKEGK